jgi:hypothetical protein
MHVCHGTILRGYKGSIVDGNSMTSLGRQRGGAGGMRAPVGVRETWSSMSSAALFDCCATVSLLAVAVGVLCVCVWGGGGGIVLCHSFYSSGVLKLDSRVTIWNSYLFLNIGLFY